MVSRLKLGQLFTKCYIVISICIVVACNTTKRINKDFLYFQRGLDSIGAIQFKEPVIQINDLLSIQVTSASLNQDQTKLFNVANVGGGNSNSQGYIVGISGNVEMPIIGSIKAAGLTKLQLQAVLKDKLITYVKDPSVLIRFLQFKINVLGEVRSPGTHNFETDQVTIIDALSAGGDLTDNGKREDVIVIREENGNRKYYKVDLRNASLFKSPVYQLQPNDIVYVGANKNKLATLNINPNSQRNIGLFLSIITVISSLTAIIVTLTR